MDEKKAREILKEDILEDGSLHNSYLYLDWTKGESEIVLDGQFSLEELEAIVWWIKNNT